tara:strand:- start:11 stop:1948 length:1938 start_codon:yes stop_codon:yes gene_type:complete
MTNNSDKIIKFNYLKEIDILRAIAVLGVILYHYTDNFLPGGWLGVDIFFVISGFLISNSIISLVEKQEFKFKEFYKKRVRRILPSLLSVIIFSLPLGFYFLPPKELIEYLRSTYYSLIFLSNFYLSNLDFYNSPTAKMMPMIHTWSLSIEEQFYIVFPVCIYFIYKKIKINKFFLTGILFLISLFFAIFMQSDIAFYLPQFRIWEFLLGVLLMFALQSYKFRGSYLIGLVVMLFPMFFFSDNDLNTLAPRLICLLGVTLFILSLSKDTKESYLVKPFLFIGKISYSLYLFHQPIFTFFTLYLYRQNLVKNLTASIFLVSTLLIVSFLNYSFVEKRAISQENNFVIKKFLIIYVFVTFSFFGFTTSNDTFLRLNPLNSKLVTYALNSQSIIQQNGISCENRDVESTCFFDTMNTDLKIYSLGDSSLRSISSIVESKRKVLNFDYVHFGGNGCIPILNKKIANISCPNKGIAETTKFIESIEDSIIIYGGRLPLYLSQEGFFNGIEKEESELSILVDVDYEITNTIEYLLKNNNKIILVYPIPTQGWNVPNLFFYKKFTWGETISYPDIYWKERVMESNKILDLISDENIIRVYPDKIFCDNLVKDACVGAHEGKIYYSDDDHLSKEGAELISEPLLGIIEKILNPR